MADSHETIGFDDFLKLDVRVGTVVKAEPYPEARQPAYKVWVDFGAEFGVKKTSAQATAHYTVEDLIGRQVAAVVNFPPKQIGKFMSEVLVLGFPDGEGPDGEGQVVLIGPERPVPNGGRLY
jgi:tRNA-binding protein